MQVAQRWRSILLAALILTAIACSDGAEETTTVPSLEVTTTAIAPTTAVPTTVPSTTESPSTTATPTTPTTTGGPYGYPGSGTFPEVLGGPLDAHGSGCAPGAGALPDGIWFGFPVAWTPSSIDFDLACFYSGDAATAEATARGEESPPPNDYIITNDTKTLRAVPVADGAIGRRLDANTETYPVPFADFLSDPGEFQNCPEFCLMWLYVNDGEVTEIVSQYVP